MPRFVPRHLLIGLALMLLPCTAATQQGSADDAREVRAVVDRLFDAMRAGDSAAMRPLFHPQARLSTVGRRGTGEHFVRTEPIEGFITSVGTPRQEVLDERISDVEIRIDGDLATAWMRYDFYLGEQFSHCGVNAFQFARAAEGWQVLQITDTRRQQGCAAAGG